MISFDDSGSGGGGNADLSPIYLSIGAIKNNTQSMWNFISTISNTTISYSTPYLETYRTENELYMYNISGLLGPMTNAFQIINGYYSIGNQSYESLYKRLCYVDSFVGNSIDTFTLSITGSNLSNNTFSYGTCEINFTNVNNNIFDANLTLSVENSLSSNSFKKFVSGYVFTAMKNTFKELFIYSVYGSFINSNIYTSIQTLINNGIYFNSNTISTVKNIILSEEGILNNSFYDNKFIIINCQNFNTNTLATAEYLKMTCEEISSNSLLGLSNLDVHAISFSYNTVNYPNTGRKHIYNFNVSRFNNNEVDFGNIVNIRCDTFENNKFYDNGILNIYNYQSWIKNCTFELMDSLKVERMVSSCSFNQNYTLDLNGVLAAKNLTISNHTLVKIPFLNSNSWIIDGQYVSYVDIESVPNDQWNGTQLAIDSSLGLYNMPSARIKIGGVWVSLLTK